MATKKILIIRGKYNDILIKRITDSKLLDVFCNKIYSIMANNIISLIDDVVLDQDKIDLIINESNDAMDTICDMSSKEAFTYLSGHIITTIDNMIEDCVETEYYESCTNIKKFYDGFYRS